MSSPRSVGRAGGGAMIGRRRVSQPSFRRRRRLHLPRRTARPLVPRMGGRRRRRLGPKLVLVLVLGGLVAAWVATAGSDPGCDLGYRPTFDDAARDRQVVAVTERRVVARSILPWGAAVAVTTRVWGERRVERWTLTERAFVTCTFATVQPTGTHLYDFEATGGITPTYLRWFARSEAVDAATADSWRDTFGSLRQFEISSVDRALARVRVYPELLVLVPAVGWWLWARRQDRSSAVV